MSASTSSALPEGLRIVPDFVTPAQEAALLAYLDTQPWTDTLSSRRQQFYGVSYGPLTHSLGAAAALAGPLLELARALDPGLSQCIVNRYGPTGSIGAHTDDSKFGPIVYGLNLGSPGSLEFSRGTVKVQVYLPPRSLMIMAGPSRYEWKHALKPTRRYYGPEGLPVSKGPDWCRTSLTFRSLQN